MVDNVYADDSSFLIDEFKRDWWGGIGVRREGRRGAGHETYEVYGPEDAAR